MSCARAADRPTYPARLLVARTIGEPMRIERAVRAAIREIDPAGSNGKDRPLAAGRPPDSVGRSTRTGPAPRLAPCRARWAGARARGESEGGEGWRRPEVVLKSRRGAARLGTGYG